MLNSKSNITWNRFCPRTGGRWIKDQIIKKFSVWYYSNVPWLTPHIKWWLSNCLRNPNRKIIIIRNPHSRVFGRWWMENTPAGRIFPSSASHPIGWLVTCMLQLHKYIRLLGKFVDGADNDTTRSMTRAPHQPPLMVLLGSHPVQWRSTLNRPCVM